MQDGVENDMPYIQYSNLLQIDVLCRHSPTKWCQQSNQFSGDGIEALTQALMYILVVFKDQLGL